MRRYLAAAVLSLGLAPAASAQVLRVGSFHGIQGQYHSIQAAVNAGRPGDWILVGPGDYKTSSSRSPTGRPDLNAGVLITTSGIYLRGMDRNGVVVDGTKPGTARCSSRKSDQNFGPAGAHGKPPLGLNGVLVYKATNVWVQNLTACNFLGGSGSSGNEVWWNGGDGSGRIGGHGFLGSYLNATSMYYDPTNPSTGAQYGIFSSNWSGGTWDQTYASNFNDSGYYIGACQQVCNQTVNHAHAQFNALGYSGSNSGGQLVIENSEFDHNQDGFDTNSQNGDEPSPQDGTCPGNKISPITHTHSCWVFMKNYVHDNNNPNVPALGSAAQGPVGTGMSISGARNDTVMNNRFERNNAWGIILVPYLDSGPPCTGGTLNGPLGPGTCLFDEWGDAVLNNTFGHNGSYGHTSNGDIGWFNFENNHPTPCFNGNVEEGGGMVTTSPPLLQTTHPSCNGSTTPANGNAPFLLEVLCDSGVEINPPNPPQCPTGPYPKRTRVVLQPLPRTLATMPNPCAGVPVNPWCPAPASTNRRLSPAGHPAA